MPHVMSVIELSQVLNEPMTRIWINVKLVFVTNK